MNTISNGDQLMTNRVVNLMQRPRDRRRDDILSPMSTRPGTHAGSVPTAACYLAEIADTDAQIGQIMSAMAARPNFANEDWLVILTTDHGGLGDGPLWRASPSSGRFHSSSPARWRPRSCRKPIHARRTWRRRCSTYFGAPIPSNYDGHAVGLEPAGPAPSTLGQNLVFNGDAEYNRGFNSNSTQQYAAGWDDPGPGGVTLINYLAGDGFPSPTDPGPPDRGNNFFSGGTERCQHDDPAHRRQQFGRSTIRQRQCRLCAVCLVGRLRHRRTTGQRSSRISSTAQIAKLAQLNWRPSRRPNAATSPSYCFANSSATCRC